MKELSFQEIRSLQLEMLKEIDFFCRQNNIKYALSCGTLIGAIRHGGYVPWDDDVDITMPYNDMLRFRELFKSDNLKYCDIETEKYYEYHFSRIIHKKTYSKKGIFGKGYGLCIDVYPIIECVKDKDNLNQLINQAQLLLERRKRKIALRKKVIGLLPFIHTIPGFSRSIRDYYEFMIQRIAKPGSGQYYQMGGPLKGNNNFYRNTWPFDPFEEVIDVKFENLVLKSPARYDEFLRVRYGDYMQLPPEDQRHPYHGRHYYWR